MKKIVLSTVFALLLIGLYLTNYACTNFIVTKGASKDGSTFIAYTNDAEYTYNLDFAPAMDHSPGEYIEYSNRDNTVVGKVEQVPHTYGIIGFHMNEYQVSIGETTFGGRMELWNKSKYLEYWHLMSLAIQRAKTAREAVIVYTSLAEKYGYGSEGESISITDKNEAWLLEIVGTGTGGEGAIWVAMRIPDGYVCAHANKSRIGEFPLKDPQNCLYSKNVISFAIEKGYYDPKSGKPFSFCEAYCPAYPDNLRYCESRVWSMYNRTAPSLKLSTDYCRGVEGADPYPLWIKPDKKLSLADVISTIRDHYEGTAFDMTKGFDAGPFGNPNRNRPLIWEVDSVKCSWERAISTFNSSFCLVMQARSWLPDEVGGVVWFGEDDSYFTCFTPLYNCIKAIPVSYQNNDIKKFSWESGWWVFNFVSNYTNLMYSYMIKDVKKVQSELETRLIAQMDSIDKIAVERLKKDKFGTQKFLTDYCLEQTAMVHKRWIELGESLMVKYNDGYIKDDKGDPQAVDYPVEYRREVLKQREGVKLPVWKKDVELAPY